MSGSIVDRLNREWAGLATEVTVPAAWAEAEPVLRDAAAPAAVLELISARPDDALAALLRLGGAGERLAHRIVLQAMLGMVVGRCRGRPEQLDEAVVELWLAISTYPVGRRPRAIACNLAWSVRRAAHPNRPPTVELPPDLPVRADEPTAAEVLATARVVGLVDEDTHRMLRAVYVLGFSSSEAGRVLGLSADVVRWRCSRAVRRLADHAAVLAT